ncbi:MAG TPA: hypothetical protein PKC60_03430 [Hydrogenophaga sp.]|uniref:hypothetical protein n=1 Tax=Hydrogenophaga sp. TaxID=1904254 RepID=UPI002BB8B5B0|nr:hypothetical protein [Hydrogenophaga sp.]HMN92261.1 hypothetical protein [Hydrogenophaga sp.]HMP09296.1 hypothetical protein [Hydrogenophaga sp.]
MNPVHWHIRLRQLSDGPIQLAWADEATATQVVGLNAEFLPGRPVLARDAMGSGARPFAAQGSAQQGPLPSHL